MGRFRCPSCKFDRDYTDTPVCPQCTAAGVGVAPKKKKKRAVVLSDRESDLLENILLQFARDNRTQNWKHENRFVIVLLKRLAELDIL